MFNHFASYIYLDAQLTQLSCVCDLALAVVGVRRESCPFPHNNHSHVNVSIHSRMLQLIFHRTRCDSKCQAVVMMRPGSVKHLFLTIQ